MLHAKSEKYEKNVEKGCIAVIAWLTLKVSHN